MAADDSNGLLVSRLFVYPVKSLGGIEVREAEAGARGFRHDRRWMLVDDRGVFMTQRGHPRMSLVRVRVEGDRLSLGAPGMPDLDLPLDPEPGGGTLRTVVWGDEVEAISCGREASSWLSGFLGTGCRLAYMPEESERGVDPHYGRDGDLVGFADGFPFLLLSQASLDDLNARLKEPVPVDRFRPNIVFSGCEPYAEDGWRGVRIGEVPFRAVKRCARCSVTMVDQARGTRGKEPLRTLARYRRVGNQVFFGQNAIPDSPGTIRVGDGVRVMRL